MKLAEIEIWKCGKGVGYEVFAGNTADVTTVEHIVEAMENRYGKSDRIWVMDRGMVSEDNIDFLREGGPRYIVGTPKLMLKKFEAELFDVTVETTEDGHARIEWKKIEAIRDWATLSADCYILRTNVTDWSDQDLWKAYIQLTEAEAAFCIHKSDLKIRPIWHPKEDRVLAHIFVCFLAYVLWNTLGQMCQQAGLGSEPRRVLAELGDLRMMDVVLPTRGGIEIRKRCVSKPTDHQQILLDCLKIRLPKINQTQM